jgi:hypothetical protein
MSTHEDTRVVCTRLPLALADELKELAERQERTVARELLIAVRRHLKLHAKRAT